MIRVICWQCHHPAEVSLTCIPGKRRRWDRQPAGDWLDEGRLLCQGIGPLENDLLRMTGLGGGGLPAGSGRGESLYLAAPLYPCYDVVYQPNFQHCLIHGHNQGCVILYRGYVKYCGFSWDGNTMIAVDKDINIWRRLN